MDTRSPTIEGCKVQTYADSRETIEQLHRFENLYPQQYQRVWQEIEKHALEAVADGHRMDHLVMIVRMKDIAVNGEEALEIDLKDVRETDHIPYAMHSDEDWFWN